MDRVTPPTVYFSGERIDLVALEKGDLPRVASWINDEAIGFFNGARFPVSLAEQEAWFEGTVRDRTKKKLLIRTREGEPAGMVSLFNLDARNQNAEVGVYVAPAFQRRGIAAEAVRMMVRFAFAELNLHKVYATIFSFNPGSVRLFESLGFRPDGVRGEHVYAAGGFHDVLCYAMFRADFARADAPPAAPGA